MAATVIGVVASIAMDARPSDGGLYFVGVLASALAALAVVAVPRRYVIDAMLVFMICAPDITQGDTDIAKHGLVISATLWELRPVGLTPAFTLFGLLVVAVMRMPPARLHRHQRLLMAYLFGVASLAAIYYGYAAADLSMAISDAKLALFFGVGVVFFRRYFACYPDDVLRVLKVGLALCIGRFGVDFAYLTLGIVRTEISDVNRVSVDSAKGLLIVLMMYLLNQIVSGRRRLVAAALLTGASVLLIAYASRWLLLTLILGLLTYAWVVGAKRLLRTGVIVAVLLQVGVAAAARLQPQALDIARLRLASVGDFSELGAEGVDLTRVISIVNALQIIGERNAYLTGLGYGSWYTDDFLPFPPALDLVSGFDEKWIDKRRFYRVHDFTIHMLMKVGVVGLGLYLAVMLIPLVRLRKRRAMLRTTPAWEPTVVMWAALPTVLTSMYWTGKGLLLSALFVAVVDAIERATAAQAKP